MPMPAPTSAPPSFYDNLPAGGDAAGGGPQGGSGKGKDSDLDEELMKGLTGVYRVLSKMTKLKKELKPGFDKLKDGVKELVVQGLKKDPKDLDSGDDAKPAEDAAPPAPGAGGPPPPPPSQSDESHAA